MGRREAMAEEYDIDAELESYQQAMAALNINLTTEELEAKRLELKAAMTGDTSALVATGGVEAQSWADVQALVETPGTDALVIDDYQKLEDKSQLVNVPFWVNKWWFTDSEMLDPETQEPRQFAVLQCIISRSIMTPAGPAQKIILTDGSTGIYRQLRETTARTRRNSRLMVRNGLRVSQYSIELEGGSQPAETYYLT